jgi:ketosteroid isomerase-like protein
MQRWAIMKPQRESPRWWVWSVCCSIFLVGTASAHADPMSKKGEEHKMSRTAAQQQMETAARTYFERVTKGDVDGILELFADDAQIINPMTGEAGIKGKEALRAFYTNLVGSLVDYHAGPTDIIIDGNKLVAPLHLEGKTKDGNPIVMNNLNFWTFENGKFKVLRIYMDTYPYRQALNKALGSGKP